MVTVTSLWLAILLSGVAVFFLSFLMWMVMPHHKTDWKKLPAEDDVLAVLKAKGIVSGQYMFPYCSDPAQMKDPAWKKKYEEGPAGFIHLRGPASCNMGPNMAQSFVFNLVISAVVGWVATLAFGAGEAKSQVWLLVAVVSTMAYSTADFWKSIWASHSWSMTLKSLFDCAIYGVATGALFAWQWPAA